MGKRKKGSPARVPTVDDFRLTIQQREFHDAFCFGETRGNASESARVSGYAEAVAKSDSYRWIPAPGTTPESATSLKPLAQAIFWTMHRERLKRDEIQTRTMEAQVTSQVKRNVITREYIESNLMEIVTRCMAKSEKVTDAWNRDLGFEIASAGLNDFRSSFKTESDIPKMAAALSLMFREFAAKYHVFKPTQAKEALKLLGIEIGMFQRVIKKTPETAVDDMKPEQLEAERQRLADEYTNLISVMKKKGNGHERAKPN